RERGWTVHRTVGVSLRRTVGGGALFALGFGALWSPPQPSRPVVAAAATTTPSPSSPVNESRPRRGVDEPLPRQTRTAVATIYVLATPGPRGLRRVGRRRRQLCRVRDELVGRPWRGLGPGGLPDRDLDAGCLGLHLLATSLQEPQPLGADLGTAEAPHGGRDEDDAHQQQGPDVWQCIWKRQAVQERLANAIQRVRQWRDHAGQAERRRQDRDGVVDAGDQQQDALDGERHLLTLLGRQQRKDRREDAQAKQGQGGRREDGQRRPVVGMREIELEQEDQREADQRRPGDPVEQ